MKADQAVIEQLEESLAMMARGMPLEACLARYPENAWELRGLLEAADGAHDSLASVVPPNPIGLRARVMAEWDREQVQSRSKMRWSWIPRFQFAVPLRGAAIAAALVIALVSGGTGTITASANAVPGDVLYPVKEARERTQVFFSRSPESKIAAYTALVRERTEEISALAASGEFQSSPIAATRLQAHVAEIATLIESGTIAEPSRLTEVTTAQSQAGEAVRQTMIAAPESAKLSLEQALAVIDRAAVRVDAALENLRGGLGQ
jgi:hypothetical protein